MYMYLPGHKTGNAVLLTTYLLIQRSVRETVARRKIICFVCVAAFKEETRGGLYYMYSSIPCIIAAAIYVKHNFKTRLEIPDSAPDKTTGVIAINKI
jgi:hypothetical protein